MTQEEKSRNKKVSPKRVDTTMTGRRMLFLLLAVAVVVALFFAVVYPLMLVGAPKEAVIHVPRNATRKMVEDSLTKEFGKEYAGYVMQAMHLRSTDLSTRHGAYKIAKGANAFSTMRKITSGGQTPVRITVNGFRSLDLLADRIASKMDFPADSLRSVLADSAFMAQYGLTPASAMALFIDDTYEAYWTASPRELLTTIGNNYKYVWNETRREQAATLGLTPEQVTILASIVDEETNAANEKGIIGRLYINRLMSGMKLQADPTVQFAMGDFSIKRVRSQDLKTDSPYNTYMYKGLPPGPIRTTSRQTIYAVLDSKPNSYRYMCANDDFSGTHLFASSYDEHVRNALRYQSALDARGIKR